MELPLGTGPVEFDLPDCEVTVAEPDGGEAVDVRAGAERALADPHGPRLETLVDPGDEVTIVVTDVTRATPDDVLLDAMLERLPDGREQVRVVLGLGLHRPMTDAEIADALGAHAPLAENHDPNDVREVGTVDGVPVEVNPAVADADVVLSTGMVEPHQYAGFSGGSKTVVIGAGSESMIRYTHGPDLLGREGVRLGRLEDNPFREAIDRAGEFAGPDFCLNVTHAPAGITGVAAGRPRAVVGSLADRAREALSVTVSEEFDAAVVGVGAPKDANLYQASRAATYLLLGANNPVRPGGRVVLPAALPEGAGQGTGEKRCYEYLREAGSAEELYESMRDGYEPGAQRAFVLARALGEYDVYVTNTESPDIVEECLMSARNRVEDAVDPGSDVLVVPDGLNTLVV